MDQPVLKLTSISKRLKGKDIVSDVNLSVYPSEIFGFLGANGAGKTTTIRIIAGLVKPDRGQVTICGFPLDRDFNRAMSNVGCIIESPDLYRFLTGMENLQQLAAMDSRVTRRRIDEVVEMVGLQHRINDRVDTYSLGMKQRLGIAQAIMSRPKLLILDEPTNGLDPAGIAEFRQLIRRLAYEEGMAVFVSSHILAEVQQMCDTVAIISRGRVMATIKVQEIGSDLIVEWQLDKPALAIALLRDRWDITAEQTKKNTVRAAVEQVMVEDINEVFISEGIRLAYCGSHGSTLEDLFLNLTEGDEIV
ncbi:MAG: ABC transporter ATP-binding protein [Firmicutes bacterium]|nr:ABC transporter ATP-binding protein [Bacillota bacterium]